MADQEQLAILQQGVEEWNRWRRQHSAIHPDLNGTDLNGANLKDIDLRGANLRSADLSGANLIRAALSGASLSSANLIRADLRDAKLTHTYLRDANLNGAYLRNAYLNKAYLIHSYLIHADLRGAHFKNTDLSGADLSDASLRGADLSGADLSRTYLDRTDLSNANLSGADLSNARLNFTVFGFVDLRTVKGLETVEHGGPSTIGTNTLERSQGDIPDIFLRGAGLSNTFIEYARALVQKPIDYYTCFISYSNHDKDFAERLHADLQSKGVRCWFALEDLKIGDHYHQRIDESIRLYDKLILILSEQAVQSTWVEREVVSAREKEDHLGNEVLFPLRLDDTVMQTTKAWAADVRRRWHIGDFTQWKEHDAYQQVFQRLLRDLKA